VEDRDKFIASINKEMGSDLICLGNTPKVADISFRSSGSLMLDYALGGGFPEGRIIQLAGMEKAGKTTVFCMAVAQAQNTEPEKENILIDLEYGFNPEWAQKLGVDTDKLIISQPDTYAEKVYELIEKLLESKRFAYIGLDSVSGLIMKAEYENDDWEKASRVGGASGLNTMAMRKLVNSGLLTKSGTTLVFINQLRDKIGGFSPFGGPVTTTTGGRSMKHAFSQMVDITIGEQFAKGTGDARVVFGQQLKAKVSKNKVGAPYKTATLDLYYENGVDRVMELVNIAKYLGVFQGTNWLKLCDPTTGEIFEEIKFNGVVKAVEALREDVNGAGELYIKIYDIVNRTMRSE
jgi:recombination protein RecA